MEQDGQDRRMVFVSGDSPGFLVYAVGSLRLDGNLVCES